MNNDLPKTKKNEKGDMTWTGKDKLLFVKWMNTREVVLCSSVHKAFSGQAVRRKVKQAGVWQTKSIPVPDAVVENSFHMGGVDISDALIRYNNV